MAAAEEWAAGEPFLAMNSDNYYPLEAIRVLREARAPAVALFEQRKMLAGSNIAAERIKAFAVGVHENGTLRRIIEKPDAEMLKALGENAYVSMNLWLFDSRIFDACRAIPKSARGEYEITDAVQWCIDRGSLFTACLVDAPVLDLSSRNDIGPVKARLEHVEVRL